MGRSGLPDYGMYAALENMGNLVDYGELAARLGSVITFNREGNIIFWDDFEKTPLKWEVEAHEAGTSVNLSASSAYSGGQSVLMITGAHSDALGRIAKAFPLYHLGRMGFEFMFCPDGTTSNVEATIICVKELRRYIAELKIDLETNSVYYRDINWNWVLLVSNIQLHQHPFLFHHFKLVIDTMKSEFVRVIINRGEYNMQGIPIYSISTGDDEYLRFMIALENKQATGNWAYIDNTVVTRNEP